MFIAPMLLEQREHPFDDEGCLFEPMIDGRRLLVSLERGRVRLYTRHGIEVTSQYPELHQVPVAGGADAVLDGEVACFDAATGTFAPERLTERFRMRKPMQIREAAVRQPVHFFAFDLLRCDGADLRDLPLERRKEMLSGALEDSRSFSKLPYIDGDGSAFYEAMAGKPFKGMAAKRKSSRYVGRRDGSWQKIMRYRYANVAIVGYRKHHFGWLVAHDRKIVGLLDRDVPDPYRQAFGGVSREIATGEDRDYVYVKPAIAARVRFRDWTADGRLRMPEFLGFAD
ncbi:ATP-dependent DNA ligase [Cohnella nanjingensis]|uniref:ATP-dependent DNA ligase n=1 Tax=Cohnella nanjingensis TaxID=1387779 RepID=A0A7X0VHL3_9BACL|nr:ATP-dependent DNA ligase [Cohnella nanjingensis]MBB6672774.1 ATP-dependent DNA ligase [Cohnella nanjingensis]